MPYTECSVSFDFCVHYTGCSVEAIYVLGRCISDNLRFLYIYKYIYIYIYIYILGLTRIVATLT